MSSDHAVPKSCKTIRVKSDSHVKDQANGWVVFTLPHFGSEAEGCHRKRGQQARGVVWGTFCSFPDTERLVDAQGDLRPFASGAVEQVSMSKHVSQCIKPVLTMRGFCARRACAESNRLVVESRQPLPFFEGIKIPT